MAWVQVLQQFWRSCQLVITWQLADCLMQSTTMFDVLKEGLRTQFLQFLSQVRKRKWDQL